MCGIWILCFNVWGRAARDPSSSLPPSFLLQRFSTIAAITIITISAIAAITIITTIVAVVITVITSSPPYFCHPHRLFACELDLSLSLCLSISFSPSLAREREGEGSGPPFSFFR